MSKSVKDLTPATATHPGTALGDELDARNITAPQFSDLSGIDLASLYGIIDGSRKLTIYEMQCISKALEMDTEFWINMQVNYDSDVLKIKSNNMKSTQTANDVRVITTQVVSKVGLIPGNYFGVWSGYDVTVDVSGMHDKTHIQMYEGVRGAVNVLVKVDGSMNAVVIS